MSAQITWRRRGAILAHRAVPTMRVQESVFLPCGCTVHICRRLDDGEGATGAVPCSVEHRGLLALFNELLHTSLVETPSDRPLVDVCQELLDKAERDWSPA